MWICILFIFHFGRRRFFPSFSLDSFALILVRFFRCCDCSHCCCFGRVKQTSIWAAVRYCPTSNDIWKMNHPGEKWWQSKAIRLCKMFSIWQKEAFLLCNRLHFSPKINDGKWEHAIFRFVKFYSISRCDDAVRAGNTCAWPCRATNRMWIRIEMNGKSTKSKSKSEQRNEAKHSRADGLRCQTEFIHR